MHAFFPSLSGVAFDLDETLYDRDAALRLLLASWLPGLDSTAVREIILRDGGGYSPRDDFFEWTSLAFPDLTLSGALLWERFRAELPLYIHADPAAVSLLESLSSAGMELGLLTNGGTAWQTAKLHATGLKGFFPPSRVLISAQLGADKPDPAAFRALTEALGLPAGRVLYVGDHPVNDMKGARQAGLRTCWLRRRHPNGVCEDADLVIDSLADLVPHFRLET